MYIKSNFISHKKYKKVMGRPKIGKQNAKGVFLSIRFTPAESEQINCAAKRLGLTKSQFGRKVLVSSLLDMRFPS
jgi:hypothetical protein